MKKLVYTVFVLALFFTSSGLQAQECDIDVLVYEYDDEVIEEVLSDAFPIDLFRYNIAADDFMVTEIQRVNTVCWPGTFWYIGDDINPDLRESGSTRTDICDPYTRTFFIRYYEDNEGLPGDLIAEYYLNPTAVHTPLFEGNAYYFTATHDPLTIPANTIHWISIQDATDDSTCDFTLLVGGIEETAQRGMINTRENPGFAQGTNNMWDPNQVPGNGILITLGGSNLPAIPTLSEWGLIILSIMFIIFGVVTIRKRVLTTQ